MSTTQILNVAGSIGGLANAVDGLLTLGGGNWQASLQAASFGGVPFGVDSARTRAGRRQAVHVYPFRDEVWVEDMGKLPRQFRIQGFLVEDSLIYGGGGVIAQRNALLSVCEADGTNTLVHPTFGVVGSLACLDVEIEERKDLGRVFQFTLTLMVSGVRQYPASARSAADALTAAADELRAGSLADLARTVVVDIQLGAAVVRSAVSTALGYYQMAVGVVNGVNRVFNAVSTLSGNFGALFGGANTGYSGSNPKAPLGTTAMGLLTVAAAASGAAVAAGASMQTAAANIADTSAYGNAAAEFVQSVAASAQDPADAVSMLSQLAGYAPQTTVASSSPIGAASTRVQSACAAHLRRVTIASLADAAGTYQPSSQDDAQALQTAVVALIDGEVLAAGDAGDDASYDALRVLRQTVVADMQSRGVDLAPIAAFTFASSLPALVLANRMYRDPSRADGLTQQVAPVHPAFFPQTFRALAA
ncbi:MAG: DNA circularization N-terminal domain-containing protein [Castellaniella sp.]|nr:DNA circularization N-terminal domain-containing protein [Castellaniella sp.]